MKNTKVERRVCLTIVAVSFWAQGPESVWASDAPIFVGASFVKGKAAAERIALSPENSERIILPKPNLAATPHPNRKEKNHSKNTAGASLDFKLPNNVPIFLQKRLEKKAPKRRAPQKLSQRTALRVGVLLVLLTGAVLLMVKYGFWWGLLWSFLGLLALALILVLYLLLLIYLYEIRTRNKTKRV